MADAYVQSHIHLAPELEEDGELAPVWKWTTVAREQTVIFAAVVQRSLDGTPWAHVTKRAGVPVLQDDFSYSIYLVGDVDNGVPGSMTVWDYQDRLRGMIGYPLYLVDHRHGVNGSDHSAYVREVMITKFGGIQDEHVLLRYFHVQVYLAGIHQET